MEIPHNLQQVPRRVSSVARTVWFLSDDLFLSGLFLVIFSSFFLGIFFFLISPDWRDVLPFRPTRKAVRIESCELVEMEEVSSNTYTLYRIRYNYPEPQEVYATRKIKPRTYCRLERCGGWYRPQNTTFNQYGKVLGLALFIIFITTMIGGGVLFWRWRNRTRYLYTMQFGTPVLGEEIKRQRTGLFRNIVLNTVVVMQFYQVKISFQYTDSDGETRKTSVMVWEKDGAKQPDCEKTHILLMDDRKNTLLWEDVLSSFRLTNNGQFQLSARKIRVVGIVILIILVFVGLFFGVSDRTVILINVRKVRRSENRNNTKRRLEIFFKMVRYS
ncbi:MAG: hypothetical protein Q4C70_12480, partial [Planctomycetia bacterium]|nr:hypothetical protein [Planctomycetia bacterium]